MFLLLTHRTVAQEEYAARRTTSPAIDTMHQNFTSIMFDKSFTTYHWTGLTSYKNTFGPLSVQFNEQFLSTLIRTDRKLITDNELFDLKLRHRLRDNLQLSWQASSFVLSDNKGVGISNVSSHAVYGGVTYQVIQPLTVEPLIGVRWESQLDQREKGLSVLLGLLSDDLEFDGYTSHLKGTFQYDRLNPRILETYNASINLEKMYFAQTRNQLLVQYFRNRRDFYSPADPTIQQQYAVAYNIETRADNSLAIADTLDYAISKQMLMRFHGSVSTRDIQRSTRYKNFADPRGAPLNTSIDEFRIEGSARANYAIGENLNTAIGFSYLEREEKHQLQPEEDFTRFDLSPLSRIEERKNNHSRRTSVTSSTMLRLSPRHSVSLSGSGTLLRYDTPSAENDDDRDELWYLMNLTTHHYLTQHFQVHLVAEASLTHLVYLYSTRSADNTWNRIIRLAPRFVYRPFKEFSTTNTFEVLANYTVYDFEFASSATRSFAFRQFAFTDSSTFSVTHRLSLEWLSLIRLYERGELLWDAFSERPVNFFEDKTYAGNIRYALNERLLFSLGIRYFSQLRYGYIGRDRALESFLRSVGPMATVVFEVGTQTNLSVKGWYERQSQTNQPDRGFTTMLMSLNVRI